jgi:hypothetical protein
MFRKYNKKMPKASRDPNGNKIATRLGRELMCPRRKSRPGAEFRHLEKDLPGRREGAIENEGTF